MKKRKTAAERLQRILEIGRQTEAIGFLVRFHNPAIAWNQENHEAIGNLLEGLGRRVKVLSNSVVEDLANEGVEFDSASHSGARGKHE